MLACMRRRSLGPFQLQAAIQALHCAALGYEETDWAAIVRFYDRLIAVMPTPVVTMNRAIAVAETDGPEAGLALLDDTRSRTWTTTTCSMPPAHRCSSGWDDPARPRTPTTAPQPWPAPTPTSRSSPSGTMS